MDDADLIQKCQRTIVGSKTYDQQMTARRYCILAMRKIYGRETPFLTLAEQCGKRKLTNWIFNRKGNGVIM
jgi:hypothetical protein